MQDTKFVKSHHDADCVSMVAPCPGFEAWPNWVVAGLGIFSELSSRSSMQAISPVEISIFVYLLGPNNILV